MTTHSYRPAVTIVPTAWAEDTGLSYAARGLLTWLLAQPAEAFTFTSLDRVPTIGLTAELVKAGYLSRSYGRAGKGSYVLNAVPA